MSISVQREITQIKFKLKIKSTDRLKFLMFKWPLGGKKNLNDDQRF